MNILVVHNKYKERGGEDSCFETETEMLRSYGHQVNTLVFDNSSIESWQNVLKLSYKMFYNSDSAKTTEQAILKYKPEVIHVHNFFYLASPAIFFVANKYNIPIVFTVHNYRLICSGAYLLKDGKVCEKCIKSSLPVHGIINACHRGSALQTAQLTFMTSFHKLVGTWRNKVTKYVALTEFAKQKLLNSSLGLESNQIVVKPNCIDDFGFSSPDVREDYYLYIGRLTPEKGIKYLLEARDKTPFRLKIIGTGALEPLVAEYAAKYEDIEYCGFRDSDFIVDQLKRCRALLFPSVWYEGMPRTILEAFSTGTPIVASNIANINEIVRDDYNGILFETGNSEDLASILSRYSDISNPLPAALYNQARVSYLENYTYESNYLALINLYKSLVQQANEKLVERTKNISSNSST